MTGIGASYEYQTKSYGYDLWSVGTMLNQTSLQDRHLRHGTEDILSTDSAEVYHTGPDFSVLDGS